MSWTYVKSTFQGGTGSVTSLGINLTGVSVGDLLVVAVSAYHVGTISIADSSGLNTWTGGGTTVGSGGTGCQSQYFWTQVSSGGGGSITVTVTSSITQFICINVDEFSLAVNQIVLAGTTAQGSTSSNSPSSGNITFSSLGNYLLWGMCEAVGATAWTPGPNWTIAGNHLGSGGNYVAVESQYRLNLTSASSPVASTCTSGVTSNWTAFGIPFLESPPWSISPPGIGPNASITVTATGINQAWLSVAPIFVMSGVAGAVISNIVVSGNNAATFTVTSAGASGTALITETVSGATGNFLVYSTTPGITVSPSFIPAGYTGASMSMVGTDTTWATGTTTFTLSGVSGVTKVSQVITSQTTATLTISTGFATGTVTISDGLYSCTFLLISGSLVSQSYISRTGLAYIQVAGSYDTYGAIPTFSIVGVTVSAGGSGYSGTVSAVISGPISLTLTNGGYGYTSVPTVSVVGGGGSGALITASVGNGAILLSLVSGGSGYTSNPTIVISGGGGFGATATTAVMVNGGTGCILGTPIISGGIIKFVPVVAPGSGYTSAPPISIASSAGSGATVVPVMGGFPAGVIAVNSNPTFSVNSQSVAVPLYVNSCPISNHGTSYASVPTVTISGGSGSGATGTAVLTVLGQVALTLTSGGSGYIVPPTVTITGGGGSGATAIAVLNGSGVVIGFIMITLGSGYTSNPTVTLTGNATATSTFAAGAIANVTINNPGSGYLAGDTVTATIAAGAGTTATAGVSLGPVWTNVSNLISSPRGWPFVPYQLQCGSVKSVLIQTGGSNYTSPVATPSGGGGTGLTLGVPVVSQGVITSIPVTAGGSGYTQSHTVLVTDSGGTGSGFVGFMIISGGAVTSVSIDSGGSNYSSPGNLHAVVGTTGMGSGATFGTIVLANNVVTSVPVTAPGSGYTSAPTIAITDGGSGTGAVAVAMMSGPAPTDSITFSAPANWLTTLSGSIPVSSSVPMMNFAGVLEPAFAQFPKAMPLGIGSGAPRGEGTSYSGPQNWLKGSLTPWTGAANLTTTTTQQVATASINNGSTALTLSASAANLANLYCWFGSDNSGGLYTIVSGSGTSWVISPAFGGTNISTSTFFTSPTSAIVINPGATDTTGQLATAMAMVNSSGSITSFIITRPGVNYTVAPTITLPVPLSGGTQATATTTISGGVLTAINIVNAGSGYAGSTTGGKPVSIAGRLNVIGGAVTVPTAFGIIANDTNQVGNIPTIGLPDASGVWTFVADESNPSSPMTVSLYAQSTLVTLLNLVHGPIVNGVEIGKTWTWNVPRLNGVTDLGIKLQVSGPTTAASAAWTLSKEVMTAPIRGTLVSQVPNRSISNAIDQNYLSALTPVGGPYPKSIRLASFGNWNFGASNVVNPTDFTSNSSFSFCGLNTGNGQTSVFSAVATSIRAYSLGTSPRVWTNQNYPGTTTTAGGPATYAWQPPGSSIDWLAFTATNMQVIAYEITTSAPHGLYSGQNISWSGGPTSVVFNDLKTAGTANINLSARTNIDCWVTSATTFVISENNAGISSGQSHVCSVNTTANAIFVITWPIPSGGFALSYEIMAGIASSIPGCGLHVELPTMATDATFTAIATIIRDNLPVGRQVIPEYMDEHWNSIYPQFNNLFRLASLSAGFSGMVSYNNVFYFALRQSQICDIFVNVFNQQDINGNTNRGGSIVRCFGTQSWSNTDATGIVNFANSTNLAGILPPIRIDRMMLAPYRDLPWDSPIFAAAASTYSNFPSSVQYQSKSPWSMANYVELLRHDAKYNLFINQSNSPIQTSLNSYNLVSGQSAPPQIMAYEGSPETITPSPISSTNWLMRANVTNDAYYHPDFYYVVQAYYEGVQNAGYITVQTNELYYNLSAYLGTTVQGILDGQFGVAVYAYMTWGGQTWGHGDGTIDGNGNLTTNQFFNGTGQAHDLGNVSPKMQAYRDWVVAANTVSGTLSVSPLSVPPGLISTVVLSVTGTSWVMGNPGSPTFAVSAGTILSQVVSGTNSAILTYSAPSSPQAVTISDPFSGLTTTLVIASGLTMTLSGPTSGSTGSASTSFSVTPNQLFTGTVILGDGNNGGTFSPTSLTFTASSTPQTFTYTPTVPGLIPISIFVTPSPQLINNSPIRYNSTLPSATTATLTGPTSAQASYGVSGFQVSFNGNYTGTITPSDSGAGGTFNPATIQCVGTIFPAKFGYTPSNSGTKSISVSASPSLTISGSPISLVVSAIPTYSLTGPASGLITTDSTSFSLTPSSVVTDDFLSLSDGGAGGIFHPYNMGYPNIRIENMSNPVNFKYYPKQTGTISITVTSNRGSVVSGSPFSYTVNANPLSTPFQPFPYP